MSDLYDRIASLPLEKRRALEALLQRAGPAPARSTIPPRDRSAPAPLSFAQQRLWFLDQLAGQQIQSLYTVSAAWRLGGQLDRSALARALDAIVARHEVLRTSFPLVDGQPIQAIRPAMPLELPELDLRERPADERVPAAERFVAETVNAAFDLANGPLFRAALVRLADDEHWLAVSMHHTVSDGWSVGIFTRELAALYASGIAGQPAPLPDLPIQYADFAAWQRSTLQGAVLDAQLAYWRDQLGGAPGALDLPTDYPRPAIQSFQGATDTLILPTVLADALKPLGQRAGATLFMTLLAAFQLLLGRYSGQNDVSVGTPIAGRPRVETEALIGLFVNTLVLRTDLRGNPPFDEVLQRVRATCMGAYAHQDLPFEKLVEILQPQRDLSHNPLFQVLFALHNAPRPTVALPGMDVDRLGGESSVSRFDLSLDIREQPVGLVCGFEYSSDIFEAATITRLGGHFQTLVEAIAADPGRRIADLPLLTEPERRQLLVEWNGTAEGRRRGEACLAPTWLPNTNNSIHELFEAQAARRPDAVALVFDAATNGVPANDERRMTNDESDPSSIVYRPSSTVHLTFGALNTRANQLAHHLRALGAGPEVRAGVCIARSPELLIALLGVLKAGSAYVPLDPNYPAERLAFMLEDCGARVLVTNDQRPTTNDQIAHLVALSPCHLVRLDADWPAISRRPAANPPSDAAADNLAYVIYTSGSTGRPKGVQVQHRSVINLMASTQPVFELGDGDIWTVVHSYAFDFSVWEIWGCLLNGGRLVIAPLEVIQSPATFYELLCRERVTILNQTPSAIRALIAARQAARGPAPALRVLMCGGEAFPRDLAAPVLAWDAPLWNFYGPTEATVWAAINPITGADSRYEVVPIGQPLDNTQLYVLDARAQLVPIGVPGELHIAGAQLARGYLDRPDLTAERFIPNPFAATNDEGRRTNDEGSNSSFVIRPSSSDRLYKTGDLARRLSSGEIEYLGRIDQQIKLRGFRIELAEIEVVLSQHPAVRAVVVVARHDTPGDQRLVAYVVPTEGTGDRVQGTGDDGLQSNDTWMHSEPSSIVHRPLSTNEEGSDSSFVLRPSSLTSELRAFLATRLPDYMIPSAFVALDALPLSSNGKVDRRMLPALDGTRPDLAVEYLPPRSALERAIAAIWQEVLRVERVGVHDNFFDLGGHSLLMVQVQSRLREALGRDIALLDMFRYPTVGMLAAYYSQGEPEQPALPQSEIRSAARRESRDRQQQTMQSRRQARRAAIAQKGEQDD